MNTETSHQHHRPTDRNHHAVTVTSTGVTHCYPTKGLLRSAVRNLTDAGVDHELATCSA